MKAKIKRGRGRPKLDRDETFVRMDKSMASQLHAIAKQRKMSAADILRDLAGRSIARAYNAAVNPSQDAHSHST